MLVICRLLVTIFKLDSSLRFCTSDTEAGAFGGNFDREGFQGRDMDAVMRRRFVNALRECIGSSWIKGCRLEK